MTIDQMTVFEFLEIMARNKEYYPAFAALPEKQKRLIANGNIVTGVAETYREDDKIIGVGGIRHLGIGEGWFITPPENRTPALLRLVARNFKRIRDEKNLWRIFAESNISETFLKHLDFKPEPGTHAWVRT